MTENFSNGEETIMNAHFFSCSKAEGGGGGGLGAVLTSTHTIYFLDHKYEKWYTPVSLEWLFKKRISFFWCSWSYEPQWVACKVNEPRRGSCKLC